MHSHVERGVDNIVDNFRKCPIAAILYHNAPRLSNDINQ
jgi:hypothetical protein